MKFYYTSDIHLDSHVPRRLNSDMFMEYLINRYFAQDQKQDAIILAGDLGDDILQIHLFLKTLLTHYQYIFLTHGNHELYLHHDEYDIYYGNSFNKILHLQNIINELNQNEKRIYFFTGKENPVEINGITIYGNPMWYDYGESGRIYGREFMREQWKLIMNDANFIKPQIDPYEMFLKYSENLFNILKNYQVDIIITHIPPYLKKRENITNGFYYFDLLSYERDMNLPRYWICGHDHTKEEIDLGDCKILKNPFGYDGEKINKGFILEFFQN